jgi:hypothetical protein
VASRLLWQRQSEYLDRERTLPTQYHLLIQEDIDSTLNFYGELEGMTWEEEAEEEFEEDKAD